jgi:hypothetical protein
MSEPMPQWLRDMDNPVPIESITAALPFGAVAPPPPPFSATGITPSPLPASSGPTTFTIQGTGFDAQTQVDVSGEGYGKTPITLVSPTQITFQKDPSADYGSGPVNVYVRQGASGTPQTVTITLT